MKTTAACRRARTLSPNFAAQCESSQSHPEIITITRFRLPRDPNGGCGFYRSATHRLRAGLLFQIAAIAGCGAAMCARVLGCTCAHFHYQIAANCRGVACGCRRASQDGTPHLPDQDKMTRTKRCSSAAVPAVKQNDPDVNQALAKQERAQRRQAQRIQPQPNRGQVKR